MGYRFFISYKREQVDSYLQVFYKDLSAEVDARMPAAPVGQTKLAGSPPIGFIDQYLELGTAWNPDICEALQSSDTFLPIYSPKYFGSEYCGKEFAFFQRRCELLIAAQRMPMAPPLIKPILWTPLDEKPPKEIEGIQFIGGDPKSPVYKLGLRQVVKQKSRYRNAYNDFVANLARDIVRLSKNHGSSLPRVTPTPGLDQIQAIFGTPSRIATQTHSSYGPKLVKFVFVAARPEEIELVEGSRPEAYFEQGGPDWKPFFPARCAPICSLVQRVASDEALNLYSEEMDFSARLYEEVREAERCKNIVVVVVDPWTAALEDYRAPLASFDQHNYFNCSVLVPWNAEDDNDERRRVLQQHLEGALPFRCRQLPTIYYRDAITSEERLREWLRDVLARLKANIVGQAVPSRHLPPGGRRPIVRGPGSGDVP